MKYWLICCSLDFRRVGRFPVAERGGVSSHRASGGGISTRVRFPSPAPSFWLNDLRQKLPNSPAERLGENGVESVNLMGSL